MTGELFTTSSAVISACGRYRYRLDRVIDERKQGRVCWVMLNPSTADATEDDPTIRRCIGYTRAWHHGSLTVVNLFAWRATNPDELWRVEDPVGPDADRHIVEAVTGASIVICGWGSSCPPPLRIAREPEILALFEAHGVTPYALGTTACGAPRHPLYMRSDAVPREWSRP